MKLLNRAAKRRKAQEQQQKIRELMTEYVNGLAAKAGLARDPNESDFNLFSRIYDTGHMRVLSYPALIRMMHGSRTGCRKRHLLLFPKTQCGVTAKG